MTSWPARLSVELSCSAPCWFGWCALVLLDLYVGTKQILSSKQCHFFLILFHILLDFPFGKKCCCFFSWCLFFICLKLFLFSVILSFTLWSKITVLNTIQLYFRMFQTFLCYIKIFLLSFFSNVLLFIFSLLIIYLTSLLHLEDQNRSSVLNQTLYLPLISFHNFDTYYLILNQSKEPKVVLWSHAMIW